VYDQSFDCSERGLSDVYPVFDVYVEEDVYDVWFVAWQYEVFVLCNFVVFVCYVEDACERFAVRMIDEVFIVIDDCLQVEGFWPLCE
jgi:hypothetical protein